MTTPVFTHPSFSGYFGVDRREITPPAGIYARNWGAAVENTYSGTHYPLTLTVITIQDAQRAEPPLALVSMDFCVWRTPSLEGEALLSAAERAGFTRDRIILSLTHTHSAANISPSQTSEPGGHHIPEYLEALCHSLEEALRHSLSHARPGVLETEWGQCCLATNRDMKNPEGTDLLIGWNPKGTADTTLLVGRISGKDRRPIAILVNYACHPTILAWQNTKMSPDYLGAMRDVVESTTGVPTLFLQGAAGELAPRHQYTGDTRIADRAGQCLGYAVLSTLANMQSPECELRYTGIVESGTKLAWWQEHQRSCIPDHLSIALFWTELALLPGLPKVEDLEKEKATTSDVALKERLNRLVHRQRELGESSSYRSPHHLWRLGDIRLVSTCHEVYSVLQTEVRQSAQPNPVLVVSLTCGGISSYVPPSSLYREDTYTVRVSPFASGGLENMIANIKNRLRD